MNPQSDSHRVPQSAAAEANLLAGWLPPETHPPALGGDVPARIEVAGAVFGVWVTPAGDYAISCDLTGAADWLRGPDGRVSLLLDAAGADGEHVFAGRLLPPPPSPRPAGVVVPLHRRRRRPPRAG